MQKSVARFWRLGLPTSNYECVTHVGIRHLSVKRIKLTYVGITTLTLIIKNNHLLVLFDESEIKSFTASAFVRVNAISKFFPRLK